MLYPSVVIDEIGDLLRTINPRGYGAPRGVWEYPKDWREIEEAFASEWTTPIITLEWLAPRDQTVRRKLMHMLLWDFTAVIWVFCKPVSAELPDMVSADKYLQVYAVEIAKKLVSNQTLSGNAVSIGERAGLPNELFKMFTGRIPTPGSRSNWYWGHRIELPVTVRIDAEFGPL